MRLLTKTLTVVSLLAPASGHTLGIGEIKLHSALNQNLDAEIALVLSGESVSDIKVNLAPPEKFDEAGVSWSYFLSKIKLETVTQPNGTTVIKVTSKEALKEPFLDFLLEVSWPKGNLYREFTVLVDPPSVYNQATIPVSTNTQNYTQPSTAISHANSQSSNGEYGPTLANDTLWSIAERAKGQSDVSVEQMIMAIYEANPHAFSKENVYALTTGKMLKIPEREVALKLSRNQALAEFNRHKKAWKNHSAPARPETKEKSGSSKTGESVDNQLTLIAPTKTAVTDQAVVGAVNERDKKADDKSKTVKDKAEKGATGAITADAVTQSKIAELEKQLAMMQELIALKDQQLAALQNQAQGNPVAPSEISKSQPAEHATAASESAAVQPAQPNQSAAQPAEQATPASEPTIVQPAQPNQATPGEAVATQPAEQATPVSGPADVQPNQATPGVIAEAKPAEQVTPASGPAAVQPNQTAPSQIEPIKPVQQVARVPQQTAVPPVAPPESGLGDLLDPLYLEGGAGAAIFTLLGWFWWRKRKVDKETNTESMFASSVMVQTPEANENISVPVVDDGATAINDAGTVGESSFLSEFTPSDFDSFDTEPGEIDPISEADVYLAYGRYQQAEELIRQAIKDQPNRDECKLKLLEIFYSNENKEAFEVYANELAAAGKRNEAGFWEQAAEMGREICPDSPLFSAGSDLFPVNDDAVVESVLEDSADKENVNSGTVSLEQSGGDGFVKEIVEPKSDVLDFDLSETDESFVDEQRNNEELDFDLSSFSMDANEPDEAETDVVASSSQADKAQIEEIDFDLSSFSMDTKGTDGAETDVAASSSQADKSQIEEIDFDLSSFSMDAKGTDGAETDVAASSSQADKSQIEEIDFDLSSFSMDANETDVAVSSSQADKSQIEEIDFDLSLFSTGSNESGETETDVAASSSQADKSQVEDFDFDLSSFSTDAKGADELDEDFTAVNTLLGTASEVNVDNKTPEFDVDEFNYNSGNTETLKTDDLDFSTVLNDEESHQDIDFSADNSLDFDSDLTGDFDFDFDLDIPSATNAQSPSHDGFGVSDLTDMDELETKLDLAKAYIDMGDADAAKDIAREVLEQGTNEQKKMAQALLDELN